MRLQARNFADETVSLVLYVDPGFRRSEQIFSDLKRHESRSSRSQGILCDNRDEMALITKELIKRVDAFDGMTEMVRSKISNRSLKMFTLSGVYYTPENPLSQKPTSPIRREAGDGDPVLDRGVGQYPGLAPRPKATKSVRRIRAHLRPLSRDCPFSAGQSGKIAS